MKEGPPITKKEKDQPGVGEGGINESPTELTEEEIKKGLQKAKKYLDTQPER